MNRIEEDEQIIKDQSISSLAIWNGLIVAGTTIDGGGGSHPTQNDAHLFIWDPITHKVLFDTVPLPGVQTLNDLVLSPDGFVYGIGGVHFFIFNPNTRTVTSRGVLPVQSTIYNSAAVGSDGRIWGLAPEGIFAIDPIRLRADLIAKPPFPITAGFALRGDLVYLASGPQLFRYRLPSGKAQSEGSPVNRK